MNLHRNTLFFESLTLKQEVENMARYQSFVPLVTLLVLSVCLEHTSANAQLPVFNTTGVAHIGEPEINTPLPTNTSSPHRNIPSEFSGTGRPSIEIPTTTQSGAATM